METFLTFLELFVSILMLMSIGLFLAMYSTGDLSKLRIKLKSYRRGDRNGKD